MCLTQTSGVWCCLTQDSGVWSCLTQTNGVWSVSLAGFPSHPGRPEARVSQCRPAVVRVAPAERLTDWTGQLTSEEALTGQKLSYFPSKLAILQVDVLRRMESRRTLRAPTVTSELIVLPSRVED